MCPFSICTQIHIFPLYIQRYWSFIPLHSIRNAEDIIFSPVSPFLLCSSSEWELRVAPHGGSVSTPPPACERRRGTGHVLWVFTKSGNNVQNPQTRRWYLRTVRRRPLQRWPCRGRDAPSVTHCASTCLLSDVISGLSEIQKQKHFFHKRNLFCEASKCNKRDMCCSVLTRCELSS